MRLQKLSASPPLLVLMPLPHSTLDYKGRLANSPVSANESLMGSDWPKGIIKYPKSPRPTLSQSRQTKANAKPVMEHEKQPSQARTSRPGPQFLHKILAGFFEYKLQKVVVIRSIKFGLFYRSVQLSVIVYFLFYIIWHKKGYQAKETPEGGVVFKVKGLDFVNKSDDWDNGARVWDAADYIIPPIMNGAIFITTNARVTDRQSMSACPERAGHCYWDSDCAGGTIGEYGRRTGKCNSSTHTCMSYGWCPLLMEDNFQLPGQSVLTRARDFTILLKNSVDFRAFNKKRRNILDWMTSDYLHNCLYEQQHPNFTYCPVFRLGDILHYATGDAKSAEDIYRVGGAIGVDISWMCNFDLPDERCLPKYHFRELDTGRGTDTHGFSVQYAYNYRSEGEDRRMLVHAYGIKIFVSVSGEGGRFDFYSLSMNLGSGLALFGLSSMLCDIILLRIASQKQRASLQKARVDYCDDDSASVATTAATSGVNADSSDEAAADSVDISKMTKRRRKEIQQQRQLVQHQQHQQRHHQPRRRPAPTSGRGSCPRHRPEVRRLSPPPPTPPPPPLLTPPLTPPAPMSAWRQPSPPSPPEIVRLESSPSTFLRPASKAAAAAAAVQKQAVRPRILQQLKLQQQQQRQQQQLLQRGRREAGYESDSAASWQAAAADTTRETLI